MSKITMDFRVLGMIGTNVYLVINQDTKKCILIDPSDCADKIEEMISDSGCTLEAVLLTHGHHDHIMAVDQIREHYNVKIYASELEKVTLSDPEVNLSSNYGLNLNVNADVWVKDGEILNLAGMTIRAISTPGHTAGGMCYYIEEADMLYSGDTLFAASVGRTDFPGGSMSQIVRSVKDKLLILPECTVVFPGHGESSSIGYEKKYNQLCQ